MEQDGLLPQVGLRFDLYHKQLQEAIFHSAFSIKFLCRMTRGGLNL